MTLIMTCDICGGAQKVDVSAHCEAGYHGTDTEQAPDIKIRGLFGVGTTWKPTFVDGTHGHECSVCAASRSKALQPQIRDIEDKHQRSLDSARKKAIDEWVASRRGES